MAWLVIRNYNDIIFFAFLRMISLTDQMTLRPNPDLLMPSDQMIFGIILSPIPSKWVRVKFFRHSCSPEDFY